MYQGVELYQTEIQFLKDIENMLQKSVPYLDTISMSASSFGFIVGNKHIVELRINNHDLTTLPESIGQLSALQTLYLRRNQLTTLPESFGQLSALQYLDLLNNQLTTLPESFGQLQALKSLNLYGNHLTTLPESFGQLQNLTRLDLRSNQLTNLPDSFGQLKRLETLYLYEDKNIDFDKFKRLWRNIDAKEQRLTVRQLIQQKIPFLKTEEQSKYKELKELLRKQSQFIFDTEQLKELFIIVESSRNLARLARKSRHDNYLGIGTSLTRSFYGTFIAVVKLKNKLEKD